MVLFIEKSQLNKSKTSGFISLMIKHLTARYFISTYLGQFPIGKFAYFTLSFQKVNDFSKLFTSGFNV